jgi:hypothetical protein
MTKSFAALAGVPAGLQALGPWAGRRQLFVRFAGEAETATMFTPDALAKVLTREFGRSTVHSISFSGRDVLANRDFILAAFATGTVRAPAMLDTDGQRPEDVPAVVEHFALVQVVPDLDMPDLERAIATLRAAAAAATDHALVLVPRDDTPDGVLLRAVQQAHDVSAATQVVIHAPLPADGQALDRRWGALVDQALGVHADVRLALRLPPPSGQR